MKKPFFLIILLSLFICSYSQHEGSRLSSEQKAVIQQEVSEQFNKHLETLSKLDYESWLDDISKDNFVPGFLPGVIGAVPDYDRYVAEVKDSFARRVRQKHESLMVKITPLSSELAILTYTGLFENWFKNEEYRQDYCNATVLWKKEKDAWKIIYVSEAWIPGENYH